MDMPAFLATVVVPLATVIASTQVDPRTRPWLIALGIVAIFVSGAPSAIRASRMWMARRADARLARETMPKIRAVFARFGQFVTEGDGNVHHVLRRFVPPPSVAMPHPAIGDQFIFNAWWSTINSRVQAGKPSIEEAVRSMGDLCALMNSYKSFCLDPVLERATPEFVQSLTAEARAELQVAREGYLAYRASVMDVAELLMKEARSVTAPGYYFQQPKPLRFANPG
jgi:hypothetical protein